MSSTNSNIIIAKIIEHNKREKHHTKLCEEASVNIKFKLYKKNIAGKEYRILIPKYSFDNIFPCEPQRTSNIIFADKNDLIELSRCFRVIAFYSYISFKKNLTIYLKFPKIAYNLIIFNHIFQ